MPAPFLSAPLHHVSAPRRAPRPGALLAALFWLWCGATLALAGGQEEPVATLRLSKNAATPGERVEGTLSATWNPDRWRFVRVDLSRDPDADAASSYSLRLDGPPKVRGASLEAKVVVQAWELGDALIGGVGVALRDASAILEPTSVFEAPPAPLEVGPSAAFQPSWEELNAAIKASEEEDAAPVAVNANAWPKLFGMRGAIGPPLPWWERHRALIGLLMAAAAALYLAFKLGKKLAQPKPERIPPAEEWAFAQLDALASAPLDTPQQIADFHFKLVDALRLYCGRRWLFYAARMTTWELAAALRRLAPDLVEEKRDGVVALMEEADLVKYAAYPAAKLTCRERLEAARAFVQTTARPVGERPASAPPGPTGGAGPGHNSGRRAAASSAGLAATKEAA